MYCDWTYITLIVALMLILCMVKGSPMRPTGGMSIANTGAWRAVFALVIILHHIAGMGLLGTGPAVSVLTPHSVGAWGVSGFFIISGYGLCVQTIKKGVAIQRHRFIRRRLSKLLPLLTILMMAAMLYQNIFMHVSVAEQLSQFPKYNTILWYSWYMYVIIYIYVCYAISLHLCSKPWHVAGCMLFFTGAYYLAAKFVCGLWDFWWMSVFTFNIGMVLALLYRRFSELYLSRRRILNFSLAVAISALFIIIRRDAASPLPGIVSLLNYLCFMSVICCIMTIDLSRVQWLGVLGGVSYEMYLLQGFFIESAALMHLPSYMAIIYVFGWCIFASIGIHRLMCAINIHGLCSRLTRGAEQ